MPVSCPPACLALALAAASLGGCASSLQSSEGTLLGLITPYRIDIVQGNVVTKEQLALVRPGMSRVQVRDILGSPLLTDVFHADRWDYVFVYMKQGVVTEQRRIMVVFKDDKLDRIEGDVVPAGAGKAPAEKPTPPAAPAQSAQNVEG